MLIGKLINLPGAAEDVEIVMFNKSYQAHSAEDQKVGINFIPKRYRTPGPDAFVSITEIYNLLNDY
jgi:hypothetical protein